MSLDNDHRNCPKPPKLLFLLLVPLWLKQLLLFYLCQFELRLRLY